MPVLDVARERKKRVAQLSWPRSTESIAFGVTGSEVVRKVTEPRRCCGIWANYSAAAGRLTVAGAVDNVVSASRCSCVFVVPVACTVGVAGSAAALRRWRRGRSLGSYGDGLAKRDLRRCRGLLTVSRPVRG